MFSRANLKHVTYDIVDIVDIMAYTHALFGFPFMVVSRYAWELNRKFSYDYIEVVC